MSEFDKELAKASGTVVVDTAKDARRALGELFGEAASEAPSNNYITMFSDFPNERGKQRVSGSLVDEWQLKNALDSLTEYIAVSVGGSSPGHSSGGFYLRQLPESAYRLTELGSALMAACDTDPDEAAASGR